MQDSSVYHKADKQYIKFIALHLFQEPILESLVSMYL